MRQSAMVHRSHRNWRRTVDVLASIANLTLLVLLCCTHAAAAPLPIRGEGAVAGRFAFDAWSTLDGLPQASVTDLAQDPRGYLYAATFGGVARFDGVRFVVVDPTRHPVPSIRFTAVETAEDGGLWLGTQYGHVARMADGAVQPLPSTGVRASVRRLIHRGNELWAAVGDELLRLDGARWVRIPRQVNDLGVQGGVLWVAGDDGVAWLDGDRPVDVALPFGGKVGAVHPDPLGHLWAAGEHGLAVRPAGESAFLAVRIDTFGDGLRAVELAVDREGAVWLSHMDGIALLGDGPTLIAAARAARTVTSAARWALSGVRQMRVDREGHLWIGTDALGLLRVTTLPYERVPSPSPLRGAVRVVERDGDRMLVAPNCDGVWAVTPGRDFPPVRVFDAGQCVQALRATSRGVVVGAGPVLAPLEAPDEVLGTFGADVLVVVQAPDGSFVVGTDGDGVWHEQGGGWARLSGVPTDASVHEAVYGLGAWWFGQTEGLVVRRDDGRTVTLGADAGMPRGDVRAVLIEGGGDDAVAWVGTYGGGLARLSGLGGLWRDGGPQIMVDRLSEREGFPDNTVSALVLAGGRLWGNGNGGTFEVARSALDARLSGARVPLGRRLPSPEGNGGAQPAVARDREGRYWFPTIDGLVRLDPDAVPANDVPPEPVIEQVLLDGQPLPVSGGWSAPPGRRDVLVRFTAAVLGHPELARFRYRLLPEPAWQDVGQREVRFASLAAGRYTFEVEAANEDGVWSVAPARLTFELRPKVHETALFRGALALALLSLAVTAVQWQRARNRVLQVEIEARGRTEAALRASEAHYRLLFEGTSDGLLVVSEGVVRDANAAAVTMFAGGDAQALIGRPAASFVTRDPAGDRAIRADDTTFPARVAEGPLGDGRVLWSVADLTLRAELEERLAEGRRLEVVGRITGGVAHEFNNLLAVAKANAASIRDALDAGDLEVGPLRESLDLIESVSARGANLTAQLLAYGQRQLLRAQPVDLGEIVRRAEPMVRRLLPAGRSIEVAIDRSVVVLVDPGQTELALVNLVLMAVGGAEPSGERRPIRVVVTRADAMEVAAGWPEAPTPPHGAYGVLSLSCDRPIPSTDPALFEPFTGDGGLGLAAVRGFATQSNGAVHARPAPGGGTVFDLLLPAIPAEPTPPPVVSPPPPPRVARVLACDDDPMVRRTMERLLASNGFTVWSASGGAHALEILQEVPVDLLLTDVLMPGMSGPELAVAARQLRPGLRVVFVSGYTQQLDPAAFTDPLVPKPFDTATLLDVVRKALG